MKLGVADLPPIVPYLADDRFMPSRKQDMDFLGRYVGPPVPERVSTFAATLIEFVARIDLVKIDVLRALDAETKARRLEEIATWCRENGAKPDAELYLETLRTSSDRQATFLALSQLTRLGDARAAPFLIAKADEEPRFRGLQVESLLRLDTPEAVPHARRWLAPIAEECGTTSDFNVKSTCMYASLILLRHGKRAELEGYEQVVAILAADDEGYWYNAAWDELVSLGKPEVVGLLAAVLEKDRARTAMVTRSPLLLCRLFKAGVPAALALIQDMLASTKRMGSASSSQGTVDLVEADHAANMLSRWTRGNMRYEYTDAADIRAAKRKELAEYLTAQFELVKAGRPTEFPDYACEGCMEDNGKALAVLPPVGPGPVIARLDLTCPPRPGAKTP